MVQRLIGKSRLLLWYLSAIESDHLRVIGGGTPHTCLPPPAPTAAGKFALCAQCRAETIHGYVLIQQTAGQRKISMGRFSINSWETITCWYFFYLMWRSNVFLNHCLHCTETIYHMLNTENTTYLCHENEKGYWMLNQFWMLTLLPCLHWVSRCRAGWSLPAAKVPHNNPGAAVLNSPAVGNKSNNVYFNLLHFCYFSHEQMNTEIQAHNIIDGNSCCILFYFIFLHDHIYACVFF